MKLDYSDAVFAKADRDAERSAERIVRELNKLLRKQPDAVASFYVLNSVIRSMAMIDLDLSNLIDASREDTKEWKALLKARISRETDPRLN